MLRYVLARWGYSPALHAFELFNEMESMDNFDLAATQTNALNWHRKFARIPQLILLLIITIKIK